MCEFAGRLLWAGMVQHLMHRRPVELSLTSFSVGVHLRLHLIYIISLLAAHTLRRVCIDELHRFCGGCNASGQQLIQLVILYVRPSSFQAAQASGF